jgi:hypothetical protein
LYLIYIKKKSFFFISYSEVVKDVAWKTQYLGGEHNFDFKAEFLNIGRIFSSFQYIFGISPSFFRVMPKDYILLLGFL